MASSLQTQKLASLARSSKKLLDTSNARKYATHADLPKIQPAPKRTTNPFNTRVIATTYRWPSIQPDGFTPFTSQHLDVPLRKDILHRAVVFEADGRRAGLASTKHRSDMRGSDRKLRPQKGSGRARLSDRKSPMLRGGGVAHGPHPRDFSTDLPSKIYDLAFRTAISHRYRRGELIILRNDIALERLDQSPRWLENIFTANEWGAGHGRTMVVVASKEMPIYDATKLFKASGDVHGEEVVAAMGAEKRAGGMDPLEEELLTAEDTQRAKELAIEEIARQKKILTMLNEIGRHAAVRDVENVEVKDLLSCGRVVIELRALQRILSRTSDSLKYLMQSSMEETTNVEDSSSTIFDHLMATKEDVTVQ